MKRALKVLVLALICGVSVSLTAQTQHIELQGLKANNQGMVLWHNKTVPAQKGYVIQDYFPNVPAGCIQWAYYFIASADHGNFNSNATSGASGTGNAQGFTNFRQALSAEGKSLTNFHYRFGVADLGNKIEGTDYKVDRANNKETRYYQGGQFQFLIDNTIILSAPMPKMTAIIEYNNQRDCRDDELSGYSAYFRRINVAPNLPANLRRIADAFKRDVIGTGKMMQLELNSIRPASAGQEDFDGNLQGGFFDIQQGKLKVIKIGSQNLPTVNWTWRGRLTYPFKVKTPDFKSMTIILKNSKGKKMTVKPDAKGNFKTKLAQGKYSLVVMNKTSKLHSSTITIKRDMTKNIILKKSSPKKILPKFQKKN